MGNLILEPIDENLLKTYLADSIDRNIELYYFIKMLDNISSGTSFVVNGAWGTGKTFFVKQAKMILDAYNVNNDIGNFTEEDLEDICAEFNKVASKENNKLNPKMATVYYDAWEHDDENDPLMSLVYTIVTRFNKALPTDKLSFIKNVGKKSIPLLNTLIKSFSGFDIKECLELLKNAIDANEDFLKDVSEQQKIKEQIMDLLSNILYEDETKLIIFIDELDRCNPQYAIKLLERVKQYFNHPKVVFVFSCNLSELQHSIKILYGNDFSADKYLRRFFNYDLELSSVNISKYIMNRNLNGDRLIDDNIQAVADMYNFSLRDACQYYEYMDKATSKIDVFYDNAWYGSSKSIAFFVTWIMPLFVGLRYHNINLYSNFRDGHLFSELKMFIESRKLPTWSYFNDLLGDNEVYDEENSGKILNGRKYVSLKDKLQEAYDAMFSIEKRNKRCVLGKMLLTPEVRANFFDICNGMSYIANMDK